MIKYHSFHYCLHFNKSKCNEPGMTIPMQIYLHSAYVMCPFLVMSVLLPEVVWSSIRSVPIGRCGIAKHFYWKLGSSQEEEAWCPTGNKSWAHAVCLNDYSFSAPPFSAVLTCILMVPGNLLRGQFLPRERQSHVV